jgi:hypothetical protein
VKGNGKGITKPVVGSGGIVPASPPRPDESGDGVGISPRLVGLRKVRKWKERRFFGPSLDAMPPMWRPPLQLAGLGYWTRHS